MNKTLNTIPTITVSISRKKQSLVSAHVFTLINENGIEFPFKSSDPVRFETNKEINTVIMRSDGTFLNKRNYKIVFVVNKMNSGSVDIEVHNNDEGDWEGISPDCANIIITMFSKKETKQIEQMITAKSIGKF